MGTLVTVVVTLAIGAAVLVKIAPAQDFNDVVVEPAAEDDRAGEAGAAEAPAAKADKKAKKPAAKAAAPAKSVWGKRCGKTKAGEPRCQMEHLVVDDKKRQLLRFAVMTIDGKRALSVWAPIGLLIPFGVHIKIDKNDSRQLQLVSCDPKSCRAVLEVDKDLLQQMTVGGRIAVIMKDGASGKDIALAGSLQGFKATYDATFKASN